MSRTHGLGLLLTLGLFTVSASGQEVQWRPAQHSGARQPPPTRPSYIARGVATDEPTDPLLPAVSPLPPLPPMPPMPTTGLARTEPTGPLLPMHPERLSPPDLGGVPLVMRDGLPRPLPGVVASPLPPLPLPGQARLLSAHATSTPIVQTPTRPTPTTLPAASAASRPLWPTPSPGMGTGTGTGEVWSPVVRVSYQSEPGSVHRHCPTCRVRVRANRPTA
jgi:hypothetical protein